MKKPVSKNPEDYPNYGLNHSAKHLRGVLDKIAFFTIEKQAEYADAICRAMTANHERTVEDFDASFISKNSLDKLNATAIGNLAYVAMNSSSELEVRNAIKILEAFKVYMTKKLNK